MIEIPEHLARELLEGRRWIAAELPAIKAENRAWVRLSTGRVRIGAEALPRPNAPIFIVMRFELPRAIVEDDTHYFRESNFFEHKEFFRTQEIYEAVQKAVEYEPDWSKWGSRDKHPVCP